MKKFEITMVATAKIVVEAEDAHSAAVKAALADGAEWQYDESPPEIVEYVSLVNLVTE